MIGRLLDRLKGRAARPPAAGPQHAGDAPDSARVDRTRRAVLVDGHTRTWWSRGDGVATTLVEAEAASETVAPSAGWARLQEVVADRRPYSRPRANPAFTEALFVELMRAGQLRRAFAQLSPECQEGWGSAEGFAAAQPGRALRAVQGVDVREVRYLDSWNDPTTSTGYRDVAELEVEYRLDGGGQARAVRQTVHLVPVEGRWRSVYHPPAAPT
ncbi:MAG: hypothetical protein NVSMB29_03710 [Candidatus Dormibacteria bacterium]